VTLLPPDDATMGIGGKLATRAIKLGTSEEVESVHVDEIRDTRHDLRRYGVGDLDQVGTMDGDQHDVQVRNVSAYMTWFDIDESVSGTTLGDVCALFETRTFDVGGMSG
jgi:hypothetical protein